MHEAEDAFVHHAHDVVVLAPERGEALTQGVERPLPGDDGERRFVAADADARVGLMTSDDCLVFDSAEGSAFQEVKRVSSPCPEARAVCKTKAGMK